MYRATSRPWLAFLLLVVAPLLAACAGDAGTAAFRAAADAEIARRPLRYVNGEARAWQVRKDGVVRGLLWGTLHVGYGEDTLLPAAIRARFYAASDLSVETDLSRRSAGFAAMLAQARITGAAYDPAAIAGLDESTRQALATVPGTDGRDLSLRGLAARVRAESLRKAFDPAALPDQGIADMSLITFARQQDRPVYDLEPLFSFEDTVAEANDSDAAGLLRQALRRRSTNLAFQRWLRSAYRNGDIAGFDAASAAWQSDPADLARSDRRNVPLLANRNAAWLPRLERRFARPGDHFVAVGASHLPGQDGLVALLRGKGYDVTPCPGDVCR